MASIPMNDRAAAEARRWFARLMAPDCAAAERADFERWRTADPQHAAAYDRVETLMGRVAELGDDAAIRQAAREALRPVRPQHGWRRTAGWALAAGIAAAVGIGIFHFFRNGDAPAEHFATATGEQRSVQLADGTSMQLDTDTRLDVRYTSSERRVELQRGRAQYKVAHDARRPFVVDTLGVSVTAVGTEFQTGIRDDTVVVALLEGKVSVASDSVTDRHATLVPGEQLVYNRSGSVWSKGSVNLDAANGWTQGKLVFKDEPLENLVKEVNRYSSAKLRIADPSLAPLRISGTFKANDQESLLLALQGIWSIRADRQANGDVLLSRPAAK
ncbi:MAG: FecR family protein [Rudaea sp.]|uniref:FecR family protein n=1 Tax=Rudaea sp. TaxID=2136325 RepID=UPI0039E44A76